MLVTAIDGEAIGGEYALIQSSAGDTLRSPSGPREIFEWLLGVGAECDRVCGYGIDYDVCNWLRGLPAQSLTCLRHKGRCYVRLKDGFGAHSYSLQYQRGQSFSIARMETGGKVSGFVRVEDLNCWFRAPFVDTALEWDCLSDATAEEMLAHKGLRGVSDEDIGDYNAMEVLAMADLYDSVAAFLASVGIPLMSPLTPGNCASRLMQRYKVPKRYTDPALGEYVKGGWMHTARTGIFEGAAHYDINSAYPWALTELPGFGWIKDLYNARQGLSNDNPGRSLIKLVLSSVWGKLAQKSGSWYDPSRANYVTSRINHRLQSAMTAAGGRGIAAHVDGAWMTPSRGRIEPRDSSLKLGAWRRTDYDEVLLASSGMYWARLGPNWKCAGMTDRLGFTAADAFASYRAGETRVELKQPRMWTLAMSCDSGKWDQLGRFDEAKVSVKFSR